jgi:phage shock protein E
MTARAVLSVAVLSLASAALAAEAPLPAPGVVDGASGRRLVERGVKVVDVRTPEEFAEGHVPGAVNIPFDQMAARAGELGPATTPVLLYCRTGRRSGLAAKTLAQKGFGAVYDMRTYDAWKNAAPKPQ